MDLFFFPHEKENTEDSYPSHMECFWKITSGSVIL